MKCKYCGAEMLPNTTFCVKCGKNNDDASEKIMPENQDNAEKHDTPSEEKKANSRKKFNIKMVLIPVIAVVLIASAIIIMVILPQNPKALYAAGTYDECISVSFSADKLFPLAEDAAIYISRDDSGYTLYCGEEYYLNQIRTYSFKLYTINFAGIKSSEEVFEYIMDVPKPGELQVSLEPGTYTDYQSVEITSGDDSTIYYTIDGSVPSEDSPIYTSPVDLDEGTTVIRAFAINESGTVGNMKEWEYTLDLPIPSEVSFSMESGVYNDLIEIELNADEDAEIFYTIDGTEPNEGSSVYMTPIVVNNEIVTIKAVAVNSYGIRSGVTERRYIVTYSKYGEFPKTAAADAYYASVGNSLSLKKYDNEMNEIQDCGIDRVLSIYSDGESIYYLKDNGDLMKRTLDQEQKMINMPVNNFALSQNRIYFISLGILYSINYSGEDLKKHEGYLSCAIAGVWDGNIYFYDSGKAFMISPEDEISELTDVNSNKYFIYGSTIYYINDGDLLCENLESGAEMTVKASESTYTDLDPDHEWLDLTDTYSTKETTCIDIFVCHKTLYVLTELVSSYNVYNKISDSTDKDVSRYYDWYAVDLESGNVSNTAINTRTMAVFDNVIIESDESYNTVIQ